MRFVSEHIAEFDSSVLGRLGIDMPWGLTTGAAPIVRQLQAQLDADYRTRDGVAIHMTSTVEVGANVRGPAIIGPPCFVAAGSLIRGGCWLEAECVVGPGAELKATFLFRGSKLAHFNFVGESILGSGVNLEAGSVIANHRNERPGRTIAFVHNGEPIDTGESKFGAVVGDGVKIGANAVIAPGAVLARGVVVERLSLVDQALTVAF